MIRKLVNMTTDHGKAAITPNESCPDVDKIFKVDHGYDGVEEKAEEMRQSTMRHAVDSKRAVVIHLWNTSATKIRASLR